ncbi:MAG: HAD family hydrolase [Clostridia bacterium]|nr:HAD family hydrolase [Clostridia bacterium]
MKEKQTISRVVWDFNGTILDDVQTGINAVNLLLTRRGKPPITDLAYYKEVFGFPIRDYYARVGFDFERESFDDVAPEWVREYLRLERDAPLCPTVYDALDLIRSAGIPQYLISATEQNMLLDQLARRGLTKYFEEIHGLDNIHANSKEALFGAFLAGREGRTVCFGDTEHDCFCARRNGAEVILIAAGHQSKEKLMKTDAPVVDRAIQAAELVLGERNNGNFVF